LHAPLTLFEPAEYDGDVARTHAQIDEVIWAAWEEGRAMSQAQAIVYALRAGGGETLACIATPPSTQ